MKHGDDVGVSRKSETSDTEESTLEQKSTFGKHRKKCTGSTIHGWFYQMHPDPQGEKIDIVKEFGRSSKSVSGNSNPLLL